MHKVANDNRLLAAGADIDAAMAGRVAGRRRQPERIVELIIVIDQKRLPGRDHRLAIERPHIAAAAGPIAAALGLVLPRRIFAFVEDVFRLRKCRHPAAVAQHGVPAGMVDVQMGAEHVIDVFEAQARGTETVEPRLFRKIHRRRIALVLTGAGVDQDGVLGRAHHIGLIGDDHLAGHRVEYFLVERREMAPADFGIVGREHLLRLPPRPVAFDDAGDGDVADGELSHCAPALIAFRFSLPPRCTRIPDFGAWRLAVRSSNERGPLGAAPLA